MIDRRTWMLGAGAAPLAARTDGPVEIRNLASAVGAGARLSVAAGAYTLVGAALIQTRPFDWSLEPGAVLRYAGGPDGRSALLTVRIETTPTVREFRGGALEGGQFMAAGSARAIEINARAPAAPVIGFRIAQASITGGRGALRFVGSDPAHTVAWSGVSASTLINGVVCDGAADGMTFRDNICDGVEPAYRLDLIEGAFCCTVDGGCASNREGALDVINGALWRLTNCQAEHGAGSVGAEAAEHTVIVRGTRYRSYLGVIARNNFGAGLGRVRDTIVVQNASGTVIDENYFFLSDRCDIRLDSGSINTVVGSRNLARGGRPLRRAGQYTDVTRRLVVAMPPDPQGRRAVGTRGVWHPAADVLTGFGPGWTPLDLEIMLTQSGLVAFNGGLAGGIANGAICVFPAWLRPHQDAWLHVTSVEDGSVRALKLEAATGVLTPQARLPGGPLNLANTTYAAVLDVPYAPGP